jgi:NAD(P)-dependent dehydrogenase (short-subunit alcohol dehydrogenase family)
MTATANGASFDGDVALVTGGSSGIGKATVSLLAERGCRVAACGRDAGTIRAAMDEVAAEGGDRVDEADLLPVRADVSEGDDVERLVAETVDAFGGIDVLVNNAASVGDVRGFSEIPDDDWLDTLDVNVVGPVRVTRAALPHLRDGGGSVVNVASESGVQPDPVMPHYNASKAALVNLTSTLSKALAPDVRVNAVSPATTRTEPVESVIEAIADGEGIDVGAAEAQFLEDFRPHIVLERLAEVEEVATVIAFLASDEASFVTGANYRVDGGSVAAMDA